MHLFSMHMYMLFINIVCRYLYFVFKVSGLYNTCSYMMVPVLNMFTKFMKCGFWARYLCTQPFFKMHFLMFFFKFFPLKLTWLQFQCTCPLETCSLITKHHLLVRICHASYQSFTNRKGKVKLQSDFNFSERRQDTMTGWSVPSANTKPKDCNLGYLKGGRIFVVSLALRG